MLQPPGLLVVFLAPDRPNLAVRLAAAVVRAWKDSAAESNLVDWLMQRGVEDLKIARRVAHHQFAVVKRGANNPDLPKIIFPDAGRLVTHEAALCNDPLIVYNCW